MSASLLVNEIYPCLQGEGVNLGKPSVLLRLQICNLRCTWCDTPYTHTQKSDPVDAGDPLGKQKFKRMSIDDVVSVIENYSNIRNVIVSGGEPTLQNFAPLAERLPRHSFEVESNGTRIPHAELVGFKPESYERFQWNISPKGQVAGERLVEDALAHWAGLAAQTEQRVVFKFVIRESHADDDIADVLRLQKQLNIDSEKVILMAEGTAVSTQTANVWLHDLCLRHGFRYTPRLHVLLFGHQRGI